MDLYVEQCTGLHITKPKIHSKESIKLRWARVVKSDDNKFMVWSKSKEVFSTLEECLENVKKVGQKESGEDVPECSMKLVFFWEK